MFGRNIVFGAATYVAALLTGSNAWSYGHDAMHQRGEVSGSGWSLSEQLEADVSFQIGPVPDVVIGKPSIEADLPVIQVATASDELPSVPNVLLVEESAATGANVVDASSESELDEFEAEFADSFEDGRTTNGKKDRNRLWDPIEGVNRRVLKVNDWFDRNFFSPVAKAYGVVTPDFLENGVRNIFRNLREPATVANGMLQGDFKLAGKSTGRFLLNSTIGVAGFVDFADQVGMEREIADFGQTLFTYGFSAGPYLVLPLLGPTTTRDGFGQLVDRAADPATWVSFGAGTSFAVNGLDGVSLREEVGDSVEQLRSTSIDWYSTLRSAYIQDRRAFLEGDLADNSQDVDDLFDDFDDFEEEDTAFQTN